MPELREVRGDSALPHGENLLQLSDRQFLLREQEEDAQPVGVGKNPKRFEN